MNAPTKLKAVCRIKSDGNYRQIFHFKENTDGSVNLRIKSGLQVGFCPNNKEIADDRISIHSSLNDPTFNLIKSHLEYKDGSKDPEGYFKTDAIKKLNSFAHITTIRLADLKNQIYDVPKLKNGFSVFNIGGFATESQTAFVSILVGNINLILMRHQNNM